MEWLFSIINYPLSYILRFFTGIFGNSFAASVFVFTIFINLVLIPLTIKSQKASVGQMRIKPKLDVLKQKYGDDKQRYSQEMQKLYKEENISMGGGCLPTLIRLPIMFSIYYLIMRPVTYIMGVSSDVISKASAAFGLDGKTVSELDLIKRVMAEPGKAPEIADKLGDVDFTLFGVEGLNLTETPNFSLNIAEGFQVLWFIPIAAFLAQLFTSMISMRIQKKINPDAPNMGCMMYGMPVISLIIGFSVPAGLGYYWACSSLVGGLLQAGIQYYYGPQKMLARERAKEIIKTHEDEKKYISKRVEGASKE